MFILSKNVNNRHTSQQLLPWISLATCSGINKSNSSNTSNDKLDGSMNSFIKAHSEIDKEFAKTVFEISKGAATAFNLFLEIRNLPKQLSQHKNEVFYYKFLQ